MRTRKNLKRVCALCLAFSVILSNAQGVVAFDQFGAETKVATKSANAEMSDSSTLEKLEFDTSAPEGFDANDGENPYGNGSFNLFPVLELYVEDETSWQRTYQKIYDADEAKSSDSQDNGLFQNSGPLLVDNQRETHINVDAERYRASKVVAFDKNNTGKPDHIARVSLTNDHSLVLDISDPLGNTRISRTVLATNISGAIYDDIWREYTGAYLQITAGDYDGNGYDDIAVYIPQTVVGVNNKPQVRIYYGGTSSYKVIEVAPLTPSYDKMMKIVKDQNKRDGAARDYIPMVQLSTSDLKEDNIDDLVLTVGIHSAGKDDVIKDKDAASILYIFENPLKNDQRYDFKMDLKWDLELYDNTRKAGENYETMINASSAEGDIDNDGRPDLVIAGHRTWNTSRDTSASYYDYHEMLITAIHYNHNTGRYQYTVKGEIAHYVESHSSLSDHIKDRDKYKTNTWLTPPIALEVFAAKGQGYAESIFLDGIVVDFQTSSAEYRGPKLNSDHPAANEAFVQATTADIRTKEDRRGGRDDYDWRHIKIANPVVGNFDGNKAGMEQVVFVVNFYRNNKENLVGDIMSISKEGPGETGGYIKSRNTIFDDGDGRGFIAIAAPDVDDDGNIMKFKSKKTVFKDPDIVAILQAPPYFEELNVLDGNYVTTGATEFTTQVGTGTSNTHAATFSAGIIVGFEQTISFLGLFDVVSMDFEMEAAASMGYEYSQSAQKEYALTFSQGGGGDAVALVMTPYIEYSYITQLPGYTFPTASEYEDSKAAAAVLVTKLKETSEENIDGTAYQRNASELAKILSDIERIDEGRSNGYRWGQSVKPQNGTFVISVPEEPQTTIITVEAYDAIAEATAGMDKIYGNILTQTAGDPGSYSKKAPEGWDGYTEVTTAMEANIASITQAIIEQSSISDAITWGTELSTKIVAAVVGVKAGISLSADYSGSFAWIDYEGVTYEGTVASLPAGTGSNYGFKWQFGNWDAPINGETAKVLGYVVTDVKAPPSLPENIKVINPTDTSLTLEWEIGTRRAHKYEIYRYDETTSTKNILLGTVDGDKTTFLDDECEPNKLYSYTVKAISDGAGNQSIHSDIIKGKTLLINNSAPTIITQPETQTTPVNANATFTVDVESSQYSDSAIRYHWQVLEDGEWNSVSNGGNARTYTVYNITQEQNHQEYRCIVGQFVQGNLVEVITDVAQLEIGAGQSKTTLNLDIKEGQIPFTLIVETTPGTRDLGTTVTVTAKVENMIDGIASGDIAPSGTLVFEIRNENNDLETFRQSVKLVPGNGNFATATFDWTPEIVGSYTVVATYAGDSRLSGSDSENITYTAYNLYDETGEITAFSDITNHWAKDDITFAIRKGLFKGTTETTFSPDIPMTRGMFVTVLGKLAKLDASEYQTTSFTDVKGTEYYAPAVAWANEMGIVKGISTTEFAPNMGITREQMAVILANYAKNIDFKLPEIATEIIFKDDSKISNWAAKSVKAAQLAGIINGNNDNTFDPQGTATRAEVSAVLRRFINLM